MRRVPSSKKSTQGGHAEGGGGFGRDDGADGSGYDQAYGTAGLAWGERTHPVHPAGHDEEDVKSSTRREHMKNKPLLSPVLRGSTPYRDRKVQRERQIAPAKRSGCPDIFLRFSLVIIRPAPDSLPRESRSRL